VIDILYNTLDFTAWNTGLKDRSVSDTRQRWAWTTQEHSIVRVGQKRPIPPEPHRQTLCAERNKVALKEERNTRI